MSSALSLYRLQQIDSRLRQVNTRLSAIEAILNGNAELKAAHQSLQDAIITQARVEKELKNAEYESSVNRIKIETVESNLYGGRIHNPKELQDLQREISALKRNLDTLENEQLQLMIKLESCESDLASVRSLHDTIQGRVISENATLKNEQISLQKELESLNNQRLAVLPVINQETLRLYENLRQKHSGLAVAVVLENSCQACGSSLTPGLAQSAKNSSQLIHCPMCGRILYAN